MHFHGLDLVGRGVHLGDDGVGALWVLLPQLIPDRGQLFAVSAPRRVWKEERVNSRPHVANPL